jgi:hypothetical protein
LNPSVPTRNDAGLQPLKIVTVSLEPDPYAAARQLKGTASEAELEAKVSSSNFRKKLLGNVQELLT